MKKHYKAFVLSYYRWYNRMSTGEGPNYFPCASLSILQAANVFCLSMPLLGSATPTWMFMTFMCLVTAALFYWNSQEMLNSCEAPKFSKWSDSVPRFREFPAVYSYLIFTAALFLLPFVLVNQRAA